MCIELKMITAGSGVRKLAAAAGGPRTADRRDLTPDPTARRLD